MFSLLLLERDALRFFWSASHAHVGGNRSAHVKCPETNVICIARNNRARSLIRDISVQRAIGARQNDADNDICPTRTILGSKHDSPCK